MNKKKFSEIVDMAISDCKKLQNIDQEFYKSPLLNTSILTMVHHCEKIKAKAQAHFEICTRKYCKIICNHNKKKKTKTEPNKKLK